jgi:hypothetical protein
MACAATEWQGRRAWRHSASARALCQALYVAQTPLPAASQGLCLHEIRTAPSSARTQPGRPAQRQARAARALDVSERAGPGAAVRALEVSDYHVSHRVVA